MADEKKKPDLSAEDETEAKENIEILREDDYIVTIELSPNVVRDIDVKELIMLKHSLTSNKSDQELENALNNADQYLFALRRGAEHWETIYVTAQMHYDIWYKEQWKIANQRLMDIQLQMVDDSVITKSKISVVKQEVDTEVVTSEQTKEDYVKYKTDLQEQKSRLNFLLELCDILKSRRSALQTIVNSRRSRNA